MNEANPGTGRARVIDALRAHTRPMHEALERSLTITNPALTLEQYRTILEDFYGLYRPIELQIPAYRAHASTIATPDGGRGKIHLLERDLLHLGRAASDLNAIPLCHDLPKLDTIPKQFGCMYVLEGSTLGGQLIVKHVGQRLGLDASNGAAFFASYGDRVGPMWRAFLGELDRAGDSDESIAAIVETATHTFETFQRWLTRTASARRPGNG